MTAIYLTLIGVLTGCSGFLAPRVIGDQVIDDAQIWQGRVRVEGVVHVTRKGSLTLLPGTRIEFAYQDIDGDGIGDGEILVEGSFQAIGSDEQPILLTSAKDKPQAGDWKFLYFDYARSVEIAHLISEYAYSGVQVHFCRARIRNSEFRHNIDGVRFSTANIDLSHSSIHHNRHGIRFEERGGRGQVHQNLIRDNEIGIFAVVRCEGNTLFERNDIIANRPYQVKMGLRQKDDLVFPRNWWGHPQGLSAMSVFDHENDETLGMVSAPEPLAAPTGASGLMKEN